ncbi:MAG: hypothetical protein PHC50_08210, partial [Candidatus Cloacimonetes bacterium]|nr:hypothetical protein [Candidatus Cloacimonadota bacterium]
MKKSLLANELCYRYLSRKAKYYHARQRYPRIVLTGRSCSGAQFRLFWETRREGDDMLMLQDLPIYVEAQLIDDYEGFELLLEYFFLSTRLKIIPLKQSYA